MGGIMMIFGAVLALAVTVIHSLIVQNSLQFDLANSFKRTQFVAGFAMALCMAAIGFIDDYIKVVKKRNLGLTSRQKTFMQLLVAVGYLLSLGLAGMKSTNIPFIGDIDITHGFGLLFWPIAVCFIYGFTNAVNLTDGIDGLASSVTMVVACAFMLASGTLGFVANNVLCATLAGVCVGFICWNSHPAKVFMGDTGSLYIGALIMGCAISEGQLLSVIIMSLVFICEMMTSLLQRLYYKITGGKRLFKKAPIHHHYQLLGWSEIKIVLVFSAISLAFCAIGLLGALI
jgi:phospho-N-acetylmuramoyl-pentapeptide-transferase